MSVTRHQAVGAYQRWTPTAFDQHTPPDTADGINDAETEPEDGEAVAPAEPAQPPVRLPTAEDIEAMFEQARAEGLEAGRAEGLAAARAEAARLAALVGAMDEALNHIDDAVAEQIVTLAIALARRMVGQTLGNKPEVVVDTVKEALQQLPQNDIQIHLHPDDATLVREHAGSTLEQGRHRIVEDPAMARGGCRAEATGSEIDATLATRWRRILEGMGRGDSEWDASDA